MSRFILGIDLGTTNSVLAYAEAFEDRKPVIRVLELPQLVAAATIEDRPLLPSFVYLPGEHELTEGAIRLPWQEDAKWAVGEFAREQGGLVADRLVCSSKSWLCNAAVDRRANILPWGPEVEVARISPVEAARRIIVTMRDAWNERMAKHDPDARFEAQEVILTVPASFDQIARELTVEAAIESGIDRDRLVLLEEPQAAFYAWLGGDEAKREEAIKPGDKILVVDMGGGTTDLSLFAASVGEEDVDFERTAVGEHLLLGGDNIDLALARTVEARLKKKNKGKKLSVRQWQTLLQSCRSAKERLLVDEELKELKVGLPGAGRKLIGGSLSEKVKREELLSLVLDGFFPEVAADEEAPERARAGLTEFGLPFESDPAVTRHLLAFLQDHCVDAEGALAVPRAVLFNGGVFKTAALRDRIMAVLASWQGAGQAPGARKVKILAGDDLDLAVARGAAYYGLVRRGYGVRIRGGLPRSYYVGVETGDGQESALCLIPRGLEPGETVAIDGHPLEIRTRRPVGFRLFTSTTRPEDQAAALVAINSAEFRQLPPLRTVLQLGRKSKRNAVKVALTAALTEIGTLELGCRSLETPHEWRLDFTVRAEAADSDANAEEIVKAEKAAQRVRQAFSGRRKFEEARSELEGLVKSLEESFGRGKDEWPLATVRTLWDKGMSPAAECRSKSPVHESRFLNLAGLLLRPGYGASSDDYRMKELWKVFLAQPLHGADRRVGLEWLITWRRVAGGLTRGQQQQLIARLGMILKTKGNKLKGARIEEYNEAWRIAASLERLPAERKVELGEQLLKAEAGGRGPRCFAWALGRLGARMPIYGTIETVLPPETAADWIEWVLARAGKGLTTKQGFGLSQLARLTGDRARDIDEKLRQKVAYRLKKAGAAGHLVRQLEEQVPVEERERLSALGDSVPAGLRLA